MFVNLAREIESTVNISSAAQDLYVKGITVNWKHELRQLLMDAFLAKPLETVPPCSSNDPVLESDRRVGNLTEDVLLLRLFLIRNQLIDLLNSLAEEFNAARTGSTPPGFDFEARAEELRDLEKVMKHFGSLFWTLAILKFELKKDENLAIRANWEMVVLAPEKPERSRDPVGSLSQLLGGGLLGLEGIQVDVHVLRV